MKTDSISNQLRWVILLLAAAVILPTVCLLWFMNQAVKNERLAVRQKLIDMYTKRAQNFFIKVPNLYFAGFVEHLNSYPIDETQNFLGLFGIDSQSQSLFQGMLIYDTDGNLLYPTVAFGTDEQTEELIPPFTDKSKETIERAYELSYPDKLANINGQAVAVMRSRVFVAECFLETNDERLFEYLRKVLGNDPLRDEGPAETIVWQLERLIAIAQQADLSDRLTTEIQSAESRMIAYKNAFEIAYLYPSAENLTDWPSQTICRLSPGLDLYGFKLSIENQTILGISTPEKMLKILTGAVKDMQDDTIDVQIRDNFGAAIAGVTDKKEKPFLTLRPGEFLPDFTVSISFKNTSVFEKAALRQTSIYTWTGILLALLILLAGGYSIRAVNHQIKMNRLKNDFIATVTHELKTPLASMRVLVDTLLDGNYEGENTATEYLQMVANENKRLTHLIDSFLTFSRMERNKQVFDIQPVDPGEIAAAATEAIQAKFTNGNCDFTCNVNENLPTVYADKDGMVTVLVNLLDNAYKYTNGDKQIELTAYQENRFVCFTVKDNGIGLNPRAQRKIFNRFYQVDSRLSRSVEGCGLGLSIVKFIVDAHKGKIEVESIVNQGSTFTVKLPAGE